MKQIITTVLPLLLMLSLVPLHERMAVSSSSPFYTHFIYMFGHAGLLHWIINAYALFVMHNLCHPSRLAVAWAAAVILSFIYLPQLPVIGASVFVTFFLGFMSLRLWQRQRLLFWMSLLLVSVGFLMPNIAALYHLAMMAAGLAWNRVEWLAADFRYHSKRPES